MNVFIYGECKSAGSGAWCYAETLHEMGHKVTSFDPYYGLTLYCTNALARGYQKLTKRLIERHRRSHIRALLQAVEEIRPDIVIIIKGLYIAFNDITSLKKAGAWVVNISHDDFFSLNRNNWTLMQHEALPAYDFVFTTREVNVAEVRPLNANVEFFPFAYYPRIHRPIEIPPVEADVWNNDVVFVGTWEKERCRLLENLVQEVPAKYAIWGSQWDKVRMRSPLLPFIRGKAIYMADMAKAIGGAKIALAFLRKQNRDDYTQRTFEIPACGGVLLAERTQRHISFYKEGQEAEFFDPASKRELAEKVQLILSDTEYREKLRAAGRISLLRQRHTYADRMARLLEVYASERFH
jgi:glycosyltransferase involved in cell wall biosynthesis